MPTYEYACPSCGIVEVFQSIKEDALTKCPKCKKHKVTRMVSTGGGVIFKGSGFWETDYNRSRDYSKKSKADAAPAAPTPAAPTQTEAKPQLKKADTPPPSKDKG
jgi:putative FmdB family regulatory protein